MQVDATPTEIAVRVDAEIPQVDIELTLVVEEKWRDSSIFEACAKVRIEHVDRLDKFPERAFEKIPLLPLVEKPRTERGTGEEEVHPVEH